MKLCVGLCTAKRTQMLRVCLNSLLQQELPERCQVDVVVVDNNIRNDAREIVKRFADLAPFPVHSLHEPKPGVATARNRVLDKAVALGADWILFFDDDEIAEPNWIAESLAATSRFGADVVEGATIRLYPESLPRFVVDYQHRLEPDGASLDYACTSNVIFKSWIIRPEGAGLRFDESFNALGGEDMDFFLRAGAAGAKIVQAGTARVSEAVAPERMTLKAQSSRMIGEAAANGFIARCGRHPTMSRSVFAKRIVTRTVIGLGYFCMAPICLACGLQPFEKAVVRGARRLSWSFGAFRGLVGWLPKPYMHIQGN